MLDFKPHDYQRYAIQRIVSEDTVGLMLDMGLGKTAIVLAAVAELMDRMLVRRVLVIAPKKVAEATWQNEAAKWRGFRHLRVSTVMGSEKQRRRALAEDSDICVINRENVQWLCEAVYGGSDAFEWPFDMVVVDESSSFKNSQSKRFKALRRKLPRIARVVILTGTPAPNGIEDLWAQIYLLDRGERLGANITAFRNRWFDYNQWRHEFTPKLGSYEAVQELIADKVVSMSAEDWIELPDMVIHDIPVALDEVGQKRYNEMEKTLLLDLGDEEITAVNAAGLTGKLLQLCSGSIYDNNHEVHEVHASKLEALTEALEALQGQHVLLFYGFRFEPDQVRKAVPKGLKVRELKTDADAKAWNAGQVDVLMAHPASCAYGLNLQQGGHHIIWLTLTWSLELYQQANARLHRQGQSEPVTIHRLLVKGGMDEDVVKALDSKDQTQESLLRSIKARVEDVKKIGQ